MPVSDLFSCLAANRYPGRGLLLGRCPDGRAAAAYFIMGRSVNSRNRVFTKVHGGIITEAADPALLSDPSLIIYAPVRRSEAGLIVTNGDQTDTIFEALDFGGSFNEALRLRTFEPDPPHYTPRISGFLYFSDGLPCGKLSILKSADGNPNSVRRFFYEYQPFLPGEGCLIHTYEGDGSPLKSFSGEPVSVLIEGTVDEFTNRLWNSLNPDNRISLFVRFFDGAGEEETRIINRFEKKGAQ